MIVAIPFCGKDEALCLKNLEWCKKLDKKAEYRAVVVHDDLSDGSAVVSAAKDYFHSVQEFVYKHWTGDNAWPQPQNFMFQQTASWIRYNATEPFFWWEADATPIKAGWVKMIEEAHAAGKRPFAGHIVTGDPFNRGTNIKWMTGCGVYPYNATDFSLQLNTCIRVPWDVASGPEILAYVHPINDVIQHVWARNGKPFSFIDKQDAETTLLPTAAIFHRCKDGSLIDVLNGEPLMVRIAKFFGLCGNDEKPDTAIACLGRYGDIINALPIAYYQWKTSGRKPAFIVAEECADILEAVSYVEPVVFKGHYSQLMNAIDENKGKYRRIIKAQMYGNHGAQRQCRSFCDDAWAQAGMLPFVGDIPFVLDMRSPGRESALCKAHLSKSKPNLLINLAGHSSPFADSPSVIADVRRRWGPVFNIVNLGGIRAERVYDLIGLYDKSDFLLTSDTATLHLAKCSDIQHAALIADKPDLWYGSTVGPNCTAQIRYGEWPVKREEIHEAIHRTRPQNTTYFIHVYPDFMGRGESLRRNSLAAESWVGPYSTGKVRPIPVADSQLPRMWENDHGKRLPFLKDVVEHACWRATKNDWILLTNTDTCFSPTIIEQMTEGLKGVDCGYSRRRDFPRLEKLLTDNEIVTGHSYVGKDLFVFRRKWWERHRDEMPDMIYGAEGWDALLSVLIDECKGKIWTDIIYHERHSSYWELPEHRYSVPSQIYCLALAKQFCKEHGIDPATHGFA